VVNLNLNSAPVISGLSDQTTIVGNDVSLNPIITGTAPIACQWRENGVSLPGKTNATLTLFNVQTNQSGYVYSLIATNGVGAATNSMTLTVLDATPFVPLTLNLDINTSSGNNYTGTAVAPDVGTYWNSFVVPAAPSLTLTGVRDSSNNITSASITIRRNSGSNFSSWDNSGGGGNPNPVALMRDYLFSGPYTVTVSNLPVGLYDLYVYAHGDNTGQASAVTVNAANGGAGGSTTDVGEYRNIYQTGAEGNSYLRLSGNVGAAGVFSFTADYLNGFQLRSVCDASPIAAPPTNVTASVGATAQFIVSTSGSGQTYQWRKNGVVLTNSGSLSGVNSNTLTISPVALSDLALSPGYDCLVGTPGGCSVLSAAAKLYIYSTTLSATPLFPVNGATGVCRDTVLRLTFNQTPTVNSAGSIRIYDASSPGVPVDQLDLSQNINGAQSRTIGGNSFKAYPVLISGNTATIFPNLNKLAANKTYFVTLDPGTFSDATGALYTGLTNIIAWQFTTKAAAPVNSTNLIVAENGSGDFCTVQGAVDHLPANNTQPTIIEVRNGQYTEIVNVNNKHKITFSGENRDQTRIGYPNNNTLNPGAPWRASFVINGNDTILHTLTLTNMTPKGGGQAEAVDVEGTRTIFCNLNLASYQDTFLSHNSGQLIYFQDSLVQGDTDFMWGYGTIYITNCEIRALTSGAHVTQPRSPAGSNGFAFVDCRVTRGFASGTFTLGRTINTPTSPAQVLFMRCLMDDAVTGYASDAGTNMTDYACSNLTATAAKTLLNSRHLVPGDPWVVAAQSAPTWLYGWQPQLLPGLLSQPTNQTVEAGQAAVFVVSAIGIPAPTFQWRKNGTNLTGQIGATLNLPSVQPGDAGTYSVVVSNAAGSVISSNATLQLFSNSAPAFTVQPTNQSVSVGATVNLIAAATGVPAPVFQWLRNGTHISGATNSTLTLLNVQVADSGVYSVIASNSVNAVASSNATLTVDGPNGFCMVNGITTGGAGGPTVTVTNGTDFITQVGMAGPRIIQVSGILTIGDANVASSKTILGLGTNATLMGRLVISGDTNIIVRNLRLTNPGDDGISIRDPNTHHVWVDHCTFYDCGDGSVDISQEADYVTVSWCKFIYPTQLEHRFVMIGSGISNVPTRITLHHNWWGHRADQRQPASGDAIVHMYNNYFNCTNNSYASNARDRTEMLSENNHYSGVNDPIGVSSGTDGKIRTSGNTYAGCTGNIDPGTDTVFTPPYGYLLDATANVPALVQAGAGAPGPETEPIPPKVWDGGGANNNLNTASNWGLNESPRKFDTLSFAGATRLTPNNDFGAYTEFRSLAFSNNAGAFVLGGNAITLGDRVTDDSASPQTINLNLDLSYAGDHFTMERLFDVSLPNGSLVINGSMVGYTNTFYGKSHSVTKLGPGLLTLAGANSLAGAFSFKGGLVRFNNLSNLGNAPQLKFDGGGLQWAAGNSTDISGKPVFISAGGATFDVGPNNVAFANPVGVSGAGGLNKKGAGKLTLNGNNTYAGDTLVAEGILALGTAGAIPNSVQIVLSNNAALDVSGRSDGRLTLGGGKQLVGAGSVLGSVTAGSGATVSPGFSVGNLIVTNVLTFQAGSTNVMELDAASRTNDLVTGMASVTYGGQLVLSNLSGTFAARDSFKLFNAGHYTGSFGSIVWPNLTGSLYWTNLLAVDGTIAVVSPVNTAPTNITYVLNGNTLQLSWAGDYTGWRLEVQTNTLAAGVGTNWVTVPGSTTTNLLLLPISDVQGSVFYRLAYP
jgi:autotransporter-associated beta strand protein